MTDQNGTYYLVDGSIYIFQSHFSPHVECFDAEGKDLSAVYGFTQFLLQFLRRVKPDRIAVALDESLFSGFWTMLLYFFFEAVEIALVSFLVDF